VRDGIATAVREPDERREAPTVKKLGAAQRRAFGRSGKRCVRPAAFDMNDPAVVGPKASYIASTAARASSVSSRLTAPPGVTRPSGEAPT
jgi:hypothetical protein